MMLATVAVPNRHFVSLPEFHEPGWRGGFVQVLGDAAGHRLGDCSLRALRGALRLDKGVDGDSVGAVEHAKALLREGQ